MKIFIVIYALMTALCLHSTIINIPADYSTIQAGINASTDTDTVLVQPGTYIENIDFNGHLVTLASLFLTTADTSYISVTVIDGNASGSVVTFQSGEDSTAVITGFTIQNGAIATMVIDGGGIQCNSSSPIISYNIIRDNFAEMGGGIHCQNSSAKIINNVIRNNSNFAGWSPPGGGIFCESSTDCVIMNNIIHDNVNMDGGGIACYLSYGIIISNNIIYNNLAQHLGGGIRFRQASATLSNNTFYDNDAVDGLCLYIENGCDVTITNSIIWNHEVTNEDVIFFGHTSTFSIIYSNNEGGGWGGIGNINEDPLFVDPENGDFHLQENSPCIDAGDPNSPPDPDGTIADMGALYFHQGLTANFEADVTSGEIPLDVQFTDLSLPDQNPITSWEWDFDNDGTVDSNEQNPTYTYLVAGIYTVSLTVSDGSYNDTETKVDYINVDFTDVEDETISLETQLLSNYPNPFNPTTTISFSLTTESKENTELVIYNLKGQKIRQFSIFNSQSSIVWDGTDQTNKSVSSGIYLYKLRHGNYTSTKKMILMK